MPRPVPVPAAPPLVRRAYAFAERAHHGQRRKDGQAYIAHPVRVARIVVRLGYGEEVLAAALLHDVVEDTPATVAQLRQTFGAHVAELVDCVSENPALCGEERKRAYRERVRTAPRGAQAICAADKVCNIEDLWIAAAAGDHLVLQRFHGGLYAQVQRFAAELQMLREAGADPELLDALHRGTQALRAQARRHSLIGSPHHALAA